MKTLNLDRLVARYGRFEQRVRQWTEGRCRPHCSICRQVCCNRHFCIESRQSVFLASVAAGCSPRSVFSSAHGWLRETGCSLVAGRPPVCYEFLCHAIYESVGGDPLRHHALMVVSMAITHAGKSVLGGRHVVEATRVADLERVNTKRFLNRLDEAEAAFHQATAFLDGRLKKASPGVLARIVTPPVKNAKETRRLM